MEDLTHIKDEELVLRYIQGDNPAFVEIVNRYLKPIYNFSFRLCGNAKDAEEITQETFVKVWKHIEKFRQKEKFKTWIYTICRNTTIDWMRKKKSVLFSQFDNDDGGNFLEDTLIDTEILPDEEFIRSENKKVVEDLFEKLPPNYREVLTLYYHEELDFTEIGQILQKSVNTVKSQHRRGLILLRKILGYAPKKV
jgi:RNA polymerase sigma-70 factor (ECF subfamily)